MKSIYLYCCQKFNKLTHVDIKFYNFLAIFYTRKQQVHSDWAKFFFINTVQNKSYKITALFNSVVSQTVFKCQSLPPQSNICRQGRSLTEQSLSTPFHSKRQAPGHLSALPPNNRPGSQWLTVSNTLVSCQSPWG